MPRQGRLCRRMWGGGYAPPKTGQIISGGLRPSCRLPVDLLGKRSHQGRSPKRIRHIYGGAQPPPHARRKAEATSNFESLGQSRSGSSRREVVRSRKSKRKNNSRNPPRSRNNSFRVSRVIVDRLIAPKPTLKLGNYKKFSPLTGPLQLSYKGPS